MEKHPVKNKSQRNSQIKLEVNWTYSQELNPAFKRLAMLLLKAKGSQPIKTGDKANGDEIKNE